MTVSYRIDRAAHRIILVVTGVMVNDEIDACYVRLSNDASFVTGLDLLVDLRASADLPSSADIRERARRSANMAKVMSGRVAQVFANNGVQYGMGRIYAVYAEEYGITAGVFTSMEEADQWLREFRSRTTDQ